MKGYTTYDTAIGMVKDQWNVQVSGTNITNSYASTNISSAQFIQTQYPVRPRVITFAFGYKF
jgi:hypothetical protein